MSFEQNITRLPRAYRPDRGAEARALFPQFSGDLAALMDGAAGCSPYLHSLMQKETEWIGQAVYRPNEALQEEFDRLAALEGGAMADGLRQGKRRVALLTGLADLAGVWTLEEVTGALSDFADLAVSLALRTTVGQEIARGKLPGLTEENLPDLGGMFVLAMGKGGARELNYSSDIDLICLFDESRFDPSDFHEARTSFVRATRRMTSMLSELTGEGYVFRTDLRLRPDPAVTPVCMAAEAAERYYESLGRTWERAAYIKARVCAGDGAAGARFLNTLTPFVWRKHLDFAAIQDAHDMRLRIREHKGLGGPISLFGHDMKLGRGGIREIEFFTQTRQLIAGGRDVGLRDRRTVTSLGDLSAKGWIPQEAADVLTQHYRAHREVEHRLQMIADAQTHLLPNSDEGFEQLACFMGLSRSELEADLRERLEDVHARIEGFFAPDGNPDEAADVPELDATITEQWHSYAALRSERGQQIFERLKPELLRKLGAASDPHQALLAFDKFLSGLPAGVQLFALFEANPQLVDLLVDVLGTAPTLAEYLSQHVQVFDAVIGGDFFAEWPERATLAGELSEVFAREEDYECKLDRARRWAKEWHFRIGVHFLRGLIGAEEAGAQYADLAEVALACLWPEVVAEFSRKHGPPPGLGAVVVGMGSLGARRLTSTSDLDVIVIYDAQDVEMSEGRRALATRPYYARLTQALVTAMSAPMAEGRLYEIDMRLRPSGKHGPVATSRGAFEAYQQDEAWLWEHLALTRARVICGNEELAGRFETFRRSLLTEKGKDRARAVKGVAEMREKIAAAKSPGGLWDAKIGPGRMQEIELVGQLGLLAGGKSALSIEAGLAALEAGGLAEAGDVACLGVAYELLWQINVAIRFLSEKAFDPQSASESAQALLLRLTEASDIAALELKLDETHRAARAVIDRITKTENGGGDEGRRA